MAILVLGVAVLTGALSIGAVPLQLTFEHFLQGAWIALLSFTTWVVRKFAKLLPPMADAVWGPEDYKGQRKGGLFDKVDAVAKDVAAVKIVATEAAENVRYITQEMGLRSPEQRTRSGEHSG